MGWGIVSGEGRGWGRVLISCCGGICRIRWWGWGGEGVLDGKLGRVSMVVEKKSFFELTLSSKLEERWFSIGLASIRFITARRAIATEIFYYIGSR